jgi:hypothetical protein
MAMLLSIVCPTLENPSFFIQDLTSNYSSIDPIFSKFEIVIVTPNPVMFKVPKNGVAVKIVSDRKEGIYKALNAGVMESSGSHIIVVNIDDFVDVKNCLDSIQKNLDGDPSVIFGDTIILDDTSSSIISVPGASPQHCLEALRMPASHQAQIVKKSEYLRLNYFNTYLEFLRVKISLKYASDFDFFARSYNSGGVWVYDSSIVARQKLGGTTSQHWIRTTLEICLINWVHTNKRLGKTTLYLKTLIGATKFHYPRQRMRKRFQDESH